MDSSSYTGVNWSTWETTRSMVEYEVRHSIANQLQALLTTAETKNQSEQFCDGIKHSINIVLGIKPNNESYPDQITMFD